MSMSSAQLKLNPGKYLKVIEIVLLILVLSGCSHSFQGQLYCTSNQFGNILLNDNAFILLSGNDLVSIHLASTPTLELVKHTDWPWTTSIGQVNGTLYGAYNNNGIIEIKEISLTNPSENTLKARIFSGTFDQGKLFFYDGFFYFIMAEHEQLYLARTALENMDNTEILRPDSAKIERLFPISSSQQQISEIHNLRVCDNKIIIYGVVQSITEYYYTLSIYDPDTKVLETLPVTSPWRMAATTEKICSANVQGGIDVYDIKTQQAEFTFFPRTNNENGAYWDLSCDNDFIYVSYSQPVNASSQNYLTEIYDYQGNYITEISIENDNRYICSTSDYILFGTLTSPEAEEFYIVKKSDFKQTTLKSPVIQDLDKG